MSEEKATYVIPGAPEPKIISGEAALLVAISAIDELCKILSPLAELYLAVHATQFEHAWNRREELLKARQALVHFKKLENIQP
jgi:hypothetical protein